MKRADKTSVLRVAIVFMVAVSLCAGLVPQSAFAADFSLSDEAQAASTTYGESLSESDQSVSVQDDESSALGASDTTHTYEDAQAVMDAYIKQNITSSMTDLEKLEKIAAFPAQYNYAGHASYVDLIFGEGGDCVASSGAISYMCKKVGLKARIRFAGNDGYAYSGHRNVMVQIGSDFYVAEAGYNEKAPRSWYVDKRDSPFFV